MTQTITIRDGRANVFVAVEHANSEVVGIHASRSANRFEALEPVRQGVHRCFGAIAPGVARGLKLVTIMAPTTCPAISRTKSNAWGSKHRPPSCAVHPGSSDIRVPAWAVPGCPRFAIVTPSATTNVSLPSVRIVSVGGALALAKSLLHFAHDICTVFSGHHVAGV